jgi:[acyl-carrier-protein] S-malonyltransferase
MKFAAVFPGQGSQSVGMLAELAEAYPVVKETFAEASEVLGYDLWALIQEGPEDKLKLTEYTQPAMFVSGVAVLRAWLAAGGPQPDMVAGHSLGEYTAMVAAGVFPFREACELVATRGTLMAGAVPAGEGGMAAVLGMEDDALDELCKSLSGERVVEAVNFNAPGQVVISGHVDALEKAVVAAKEAGAKRAMLLPVSVPNHSSLMQGVVAPLAEKIDSTPANEPQVPVLQNAEGKAYATLPEMLAALRGHVAGPVYWTATVNEMKAQGIEMVVEFGPGKVLAGLVKRVDRRFPAVCVEDTATLEKALDAVRGEA